MTMYGIIYKAVNSVNGKIYIGLTTSDLEIRKYQHRNKSEKQKNKQLLYKAIRKYGWVNFEWEIIDHAENEDELNKKEVTWIEFYNSYAFKENSNGYNMTIGGESTKGVRLSDETRKRISEATKGANNPNYGNRHSDEARQKIREKRIGLKLSEETIVKFKEARKGEGNSNSKLTENDVRQARELYSTGWYTYSFLAKVFGVSKENISYAIRGKTWSYVI